MIKTKTCAPLGASISVTLDNDGTLEMGFSSKSLPAYFPVLSGHGSVHWYKRHPNISLLTPFKACSVWPRRMSAHERLRTQSLAYAARLAWVTACAKALTPPGAQEILQAPAPACAHCPAPHPSKTCRCLRRLAAGALTALTCRSQNRPMPGAAQEP